jgi:hypothetical protein
VATGNQRHFIVPGVGIVYARAGHVVIDLNNGSVLTGIRSRGREPLGSETGAAFLGNKPAW